MTEYNLSIDQLREAHRTATKLADLRVQLHDLKGKLNLSNTIMIGRSDRRAEGGVAGYIQVELTPLARDKLLDLLDLQLRGQIIGLEAKLSKYGVNPDFSTKPMTAEDEALLLGVLK